MNYSRPGYMPFRFGREKAGFILSSFDQTASEKKTFTSVGNCWHGHYITYTINVLLPYFFI